ncbi:MAG: hypothetical protein ABEJ42_08200 [Halobacteriaceae archaeon]
MSVLGDLRARTGVGPGGVCLYVALLAGGLALVLARGSVGAADEDPVLLVTGLGYALGLLGVTCALSNLPRVLLVAVARRLSPDGLVARRGQVAPVEAAASTPFRGAPAVCHRWRVLEGDPGEGTDEGAAHARSGDATGDEASGPTSRSASLVDAGTGGVPFDLDARDGRYRVDPADAAVRVDGTASVAVGADDAPPESVAAGCEAVGLSPAPAGVARRYEESVLAPGDEAFVLGSATDGAVDGGWRFLVADPGYPGRVRGRVLSGLLLGVPTAAAGLAALGWAAGAI